MPSKVEKWKGILKTLMSPGGSSVEASEGRMEKRSKKLEEMGPGHTGGMFDIIYKKRKERENSVKWIDD